MVQEQDHSPDQATSEQEEPVRERLEKTTIAKAGTQPTSEPEQDPSAQKSERGRILAKKRSHEELEDAKSEVTATTQSARHHSRKRSRGSSAEENELNNGSRKSVEKPRTGSHDALFAGDVTNGETSGENLPDDRSGTPEPRKDKRAEAAVEDMTSPKTKRSKLHSAIGDENGSESEGLTKNISKAPPEDISVFENSTTNESEDPAAVKPTKSPPSIGFANTSSASPFGALTSSKSSAKDPPQTSSSAFAASGFGSLGSTASSGFGAVSKSSGGFGIGGSFATGAKSPPSAGAGAEGEKNEGLSGSTFGGKLGATSAFAAAAGNGGIGSGFGKIGSSGAFGGGSGFGSLAGGGLTSFASGKSTTFSSSVNPTVPFGASADMDENDKNDGEDRSDNGIKSPLSQEEDLKDERFYERDLETGEENEETQYSSRAKIYVFAALDDGTKKEWRERGLGTLRLNVRVPGDDASKYKARLLMRAEGSHRVVLNTPVKKEIQFGQPRGGPPQGGSMFFQGVIDGEENLQLLQLKMKQQNALDLHEKIEDLKKLM